MPRSIAEIRKANGGLENLTDEDILQSTFQQYKSYYPSLDAYAAEVGYGGAGRSLTGSRISAGIDQYQANLQGLGGAVSRAVGAEGLAAGFDRSRAANEAAAAYAAQRARDLGGVEDWRGVTGVGSTLNFAGGLAAQALPYLGEAVAGGLTGGLALGGTAARMGLSRAAAATAGAVGASYPSAVGDILSAQREAGGENLGAAALGGIPYAALNAVGIEGMAARGLRPLIRGEAGVARRMATGAAEGVVGEGFGETGQELVNQYAGRMAVDPNETLFNDEANKRYLDSFVGGATLGGLMGSVGGIRAPRQDVEKDLTQPEPPALAEITPVPRTGLDTAALLGNPYANANPLGGTYAGIPLVAPSIVGQETDLTAPADTTAAAATPAAPVVETKPATASIFSELDTKLNKQGIRPTKASRDIYQYMEAEGIDPASPEAESVMNALAAGKAGEARKAVGEIIRARSPRGTGVSTVQQPAGGVGGGSAVVPGVVGTAGPSVAPTGGDVQPARTAGAPVQQTGILPVATGQPAAPVVAAAPAVPETKFRRAPRPMTVLEAANAAKAAQTQQTETQGQEAPAAAEPVVDQRQATLQQIFGSRNGDIIFDVVGMGMPEPEAATKYDLSRQAIQKIAGATGQKTWPERIARAKTEFGLTDAQIAEAFNVAPQEELGTEVEREVFGRGQAADAITEAEAIEGGLENIVKTAGAGTAEVEGFSKLDKEIDAALEALAAETDEKVIAELMAKMVELTEKAKAVNKRKQSEVRSTAGKVTTEEEGDAVQVESPAGVSVQPEAETGQGVGGQVRRAKKPATEGKAAAPAAPAKVLTEAEQAAQAWDVVVADYPQAPKFADLTKAQQADFVEFGPGNWERGDVELELTKLAKQPTAKVDYPTPPPGAPAYVQPAQRAVVDFMNGDVTKQQLLERFAKLGMTEGQIRSVANRIDITKDEIDSVQDLKAVLGFTRQSRQSTRLFSTDLYLGKENVSGQPQYGRELRNPVTLNDGTRLDGFTGQDQSVFSGYDRNGQRISVPQESVKPSDIKSSRDSNRTANALSAALGTTRKSRRSVRTADQSGTEFESVEASLDDLSGYSEGIAAGIRSLRSSGMGNAVDAIDSWMVTFSPVSWDAIYTMIDGKRTIIYNGVILKDKILSTTATLHEVGHGIDEVQSGAGKFSNDKEFKLSRVNGELMSMRPGTAMDELLNHFEDSSETSPIGALLNYPLDMSDANNRSLTIQELREEVFAQVWAFSNMNGGMDYLRDNLPATHAFMEKVHEQVKATNYAAAQGAQQGTQSGQVQAGQQNAQPAGAISRASRQAKVDKAVSQLPKQAQQPVRSSINTISDWMRQGLDRLVFTSDLINRAVAVGIKSAAKFESLLAKRSTKARELEREVERVADMYATIEEAHKGDGPNSVNQFIFESTRTGKWGYDSGSFKADPEMAKQFNALVGPKAQAYVKAIFTHGNKMLSAKKKAVIDYTSSEYDARIAAETDSLKKAALVRDKANDLKKFARLFKIREGIPYAPIKRFGDHVAVAKSQAYIDAVAAKDSKLVRQLEKDPDHYHVSFTETKNEARNLAAQLEAQGFFSGGTVAFFERSVAEKELFGSRDSLGAITKLRSMADAKANAGDKGAAQIQRMVSDMYLQALAEGSARKSEMRRRGVAGEIDMLRSFAAQGRADANFVASVEYNPQVQDALQAMRKEGKEGSGDLNRKSEIMNEITRRYESSLEVTPTPNIAKLTRLSSIYFLATSPAYYLQNLTQPWMMSVPAMAGRHDYGKTSTALFTAYSQLGGVMKSARYDQQFDFDKVPADVRGAIQELVNRGKIDIGLETELGEFKIDGDSKFSKGWNKVDKFLRVAVQKVESLNRLSTAMAAYRLELERAKKDPKIADPEAAAINYADRILTETHGDYSSFNAPRVFNNPIGKVALQFRKFQLIQLTYYAKLLKDAGFDSKEKRAATKALVYSLSHTGLLAGAMGLPGYSAFAWAIGALFGDDDEPLDVTAELRKFIGDEDMANLIMRGAPTLAGVDISGKVGAGNMLSIMPFSNADLTTKAGILEAVGTAVGGAPVGMVARVADGLGQMLSGNWYKGMEQILPKGLGDAAKAYRLSSEGMTRRNGDLVLPASEVSAWEALVQAMGIQPVQQSVVMERQSNTLEMNQFYQDRSTKIKADYIKAVRAGESTAEARAAWTKLQEARVNNGYTRQPLSELLKAPQSQAKREKQAVNGVQFNKANKRFVEEQV